MTKQHLVWFRNDLRVRDNPALAKACEDKEATVCAIYIVTPEQWKMHDLAARQAQFIYNNLQKLQKSLADLNIALHVEHCKDFSETSNLLKEFCNKHKVDHLFYNRQYEYNEHQRDEQVKEKLQGKIDISEFDGNLFLLPLSVRNGQGGMYKVFTPFRNAFIDQFLQNDIKIHKVPTKRKSDKFKTSNISKFDYPMQSYELFKKGENAALRHLKQFCAERIEDYDKKRDIPSLEYTSQLSAYLSIGVLSVRQCFYYLNKEHSEFWKHRNSGAFQWFTELVWREFYQNLIVAYPELCRHKPFIEWTSHISWSNDKGHFENWKEGKTGYPIVDAAMRQLNKTGWMHNRLRMIVASFLVKDLLIDWHWGEQYFISQLTDGDLAANNGGWQWAASTGTDSSPYFRIFNPTTQSKRFDPKGDFIRKWIPELKDVPNKYIHTPHAWAEKKNKKLSYPSPIITHDQARKKTLEEFEKAKNSA